MYDDIKIGVIIEVWFKNLEQAIKPRGMWMVVVATAESGQPGYHRAFNKNS